MFNWLKNIGKGALTFVVPFAYPLIWDKELKEWRKKGREEGEKEIQRNILPLIIILIISFIILKKFKVI